MFIDSNAGMFHVKACMLSSSQCGVWSARQVNNVDDECACF